MTGRHEVVRLLQGRSEILGSRTLSTNDLASWIDDVVPSVRSELVDGERLIDILVADAADGGEAVFAAMVIGMRGAIELWCGSTQREALIEFFDQTPQTRVEECLSYIRSASAFLRGPFEDLG